MKKMKVMVLNVPQHLMGYVESALEGLAYPNISHFSGTISATTWASKDAYDCWENIEPLLKAKNLNYEVQIK